MGRAQAATTSATSTRNPRRSAATRPRCVLRSVRLTTFPSTEHPRAGGYTFACALLFPLTSAALQAELDRYLFYYQRFSNHDQAGRFAAKHRESTQRVRAGMHRPLVRPHSRSCFTRPRPASSRLQRMAELQSAGGLSYTDVTFLNDATEALLEVSCPQQRCAWLHIQFHVSSSSIRMRARAAFAWLLAMLQCRRVLKYTYVFGYYMKESAEKRLFEYLQVRACAACSTQPLSLRLRSPACFLARPSSCPEQCRSSWSGRLSTSQS